jgi:pimeloyl-ACP methyl ester carboxylesterase
MAVQTRPLNAADIEQRERLWANIVVLLLCTLAPSPPSAAATGALCLAADPTSAGDHPRPLRPGRERAPEARRAVVDGRWAYAVRVLPEVRYVRSGGASIAFQVFGDGPPDVVFALGFVSQLDLAWQEPSLARFLRGLGSFSRVIWFDRVGTGLSDARPGASALEDEVRDVEAVMDAAGCERAVHFGVAVGAGLCVHHAAEHRERVSALVLFAAHARLLRGADYVAGWTSEQYAAVLEQIDAGWGRGEVVELMNPSVAGDERFRSWFRRYCRAGAGPAQVRRVFEACAAMDLVPLLDRLDVPTLRDVSFLHPVSTPDEFWHGLLSGTVRTAAIVRAQPEPVRRRVRDAFDRLLEAHRIGDRYELPVSVKLAAAHRSTSLRAS